MPRKPIDRDDTPGEPSGYGHPPIHNRIRDGEKRNPWGRKGKPKPKIEFLDEVIVIRVDGEPRRMTRGEALDFFLFAKAAKGDVRAIRTLEERERKRQKDGSASPDIELSPEEQAAFDRFVRRAAQRLGPEEPT